MEEYPMENSNGIWQWSRDRKKLFRMSKIHSRADGFSSVAKMGSLADGFSPNIILKGKQCIDDSPLRRSSATLEENSLKSRAYCRDMCLPVQNSIEEVGPFENGDSTKSPVSVIRRHVSSSGFKTDHPHGGSDPSGPSLRWPLGFANEGMKGYLGQYAACNREHLLKASSSCSISKVLAEDIELQSRNVNEGMRDLRHVACCETSSNYINWPGHPPVRKKPKRNQSLVSETSTSPFEIENQKTKSEILFQGLHLLADVAVRILENDFPENSLTEENGIRKEIFIPRGVPFMQERVPRRAKSAFKYHQPYAWPMVHDIQKNLSAAYSKPLLTVDNICRLGDPACIKQSENQVVGNGIDEDPMVIPPNDEDPMENDVAGLHENSLTDEKGIRKAIFIPTGVPFFQERVPRRAKSAFKHRQVLHDLEKSPSAAKSEPLLMANNICKLGDPDCIKQSENEVVCNGVNEDPMATPHVRRSKRTRSQALPSKYRDCVLQPWKRGTGR